MRLFVGLEIPENVSDALLDLQTGLHGAAWRPVENFHITLRFIGETDGATARDIDAALAGLRAAPFSLQLSGCGWFGDRKPRAVWAGVAPSPDLAALQNKVEMAVRSAGVPPEGRKFKPHVTLAYLKGSRQEEVEAYAAAHTAFKSAPFAVGAFYLYSSHMGRDVSVYRQEATYALSK